MTSISICRTVNTISMGIDHNKDYIKVKKTMFPNTVIHFMLKEGMLASVSPAPEDANIQVVGLKKVAGQQVFKNLTLWSRPGYLCTLTKFKLRGLMYSNPSVIFVLFTNKGLATGKDALAAGQAGELLFSIEPV